jgi:hypothetical protein
MFVLFFLTTIPLRVSTVPSLVDGVNAGIVNKAVVMVYESNLSLKETRMGKNRIIGIALTNID